MIRVAFHYPNKPGSRFDVEYYRNNFVKSKDIFGPGLKTIELDVGVAGAKGPAPYHVISYLIFDSMESFKQGFALAAPHMGGDMSAYTDVQPEMQVSSYETLYSV